MNWSTIRSSLTTRELAGDFVVYYTAREPAPTIDHGVRGIRSQKIVENYRRSLEWVGQRWSALGLSPPRAPISAYVFGLREIRRGGAYTFFDKECWSCALPCRSNKASAREELSFFRAVAVHEGTHCYCVQQPGFFAGELYLPDPWIWLAEGCAVWMELLLLDHPEGLGSRQGLRACCDWCDCPHHSMTRGRSYYQSGMFIRYLAKRFGEGTIGKLWTVGTRQDDPCQLLAQLTKCDTLAIDYAVDSYFLKDPNSFCFCPEVANRYVSRAGRSLNLLGGRIATEGTLEDAGVDYYFISVREIQSLEVRFKSDSNDQSKPLVAAAAIASEARLRISSMVSIGENPKTLIVPSGGDHVLVAVTSDLSKFAATRVRLNYELEISTE